MGYILFSWSLAAILGFAAHRGSVCTVRAVAEILSTGRAYYLLSFAKSALWVLAIIGPAIWLDTSNSAQLLGQPLSMGAILGGFVFGVGAALNAGCAFSTLSRLADGQLRMMATLLGMGFAAFGVVATLETDAVSHPKLSTLIATPLVSLRPFGILLSGLLLVWVVWEFRRLYRTRLDLLSLRYLILERQYRLSTAAALMGTANGLLFMLIGAWDYTGALRMGFDVPSAPGSASLDMRLLMVTGVVSGMAVSTWQRGGFRWDYTPRPAWFMNLAGGALMGAGSALVPGGNDYLILFAVPLLSPHALPAYLSLLLGVASAIGVMRLLTGNMLVIRCDGDVCRSAIEHQVRL